MPSHTDPANQTGMIEIYQMENRILDLQAKIRTGGAKVSDVHVGTKLKSSSGFAIIMGKT